ncbi:polyamine oxidase 1-like [Acropora millepora]|uniref:polyamine oxidase 1-like n=1 Tax=Acropora millepora TaxID=45264 RepID=UPI001CF21750|nr:polyamine oxidase 1-like [Acropora millepora]
METVKSLLVFWLSLSFGASSPQEKKKVLILGAGVSGITAAKTLFDQGVTDFLVLEGQSYIGGRVTQASFAGMRVEMGANWIHHSEQDENPLIPLKNKNDLNATPSNYSRHIIRNDTGADVTNTNLSKEWAVARDKLFEMGEANGKKDIPPIDVPATTGLKKLGWISDTPLKKVLSWSDINFQYGVGEEEASLNNMGAAGEDTFINDKRGVWSLYRDFYSNFLDKILVNQTVTRIKYSDKSVEVTTAKGIIYAAEYALCTFSNGVLESKMVTFDPDLPDWKKEAISRMRMVYYTKIFLRFPRKFWDDSEFILHVSRQGTGHFPHFQNLDRPGFFEGTRMLLATVTGDVALRIEAQDDSKTLDEVMQVLRNMYGDGIPNATEIVVSKWSQNPYVRGSWSDPVVGTDHSAHANMARPIKNLFFGGEAVHGEWYGFMQGAYYSGRERASQIASLIQRENCEAKQGPILSECLISQMPQRNGCDRLSYRP